MIMTLAMGVCGCMKDNKSNGAEEAKRIALEYLNKNYDDTFTALGYTSNNWAYNYESIRFNSQRYDDAIEVRIYNENGDTTFKDDYFKLTMKTDAEDYFAAIASKYGYKTETKVNFAFFELPEGIDGNSKFSEYVSTGKCDIEVYYISNFAFDEYSVNSILNDVCNAKIMGYFRFIETNDNNLLAQYSIDEIVNEKSDSIISKQRYTIDTDYKVVQ